MFLEVWRRDLFKNLTPSLPFLQGYQLALAYRSISACHGKSVPWDCPSLPLEALCSLDGEPQGGLGHARAKPRRRWLSPRHR